MCSTTPGPPNVDATSAANLTDSGAVLNALISPNSSATTYHFEYGPNESYGQRTPESGPIGSDTADHQISATLSGLAPSTTYHFRVMATNGVGATAGSDHTFTTSEAASVVSKAPPLRCAHSQVKRNGKCVKRKKKHRRTHPQSNHGHEQARHNG